MAKPLPSGLWSVHTGFVVFTPSPLLCLSPLRQCRCCCLKHVLSLKAASVRAESFPFFFLRITVSTFCLSGRSGVDRPPFFAEYYVLMDFEQHACAVMSHASVTQALSALCSGDVFGNACPGAQQPLLF